MKRMVLAAAALAATAFTAAAPSAAFAQDHYRGGHHARYDHGGDNQDYHSQPRWAGDPYGTWSYNQQWQNNGHARGHDRRGYTGHGYDGRQYDVHGYDQRHGGGHY
ncbi:MULTISPECIES: hypothetical protein [Sphingomonadaceae]|uniref:Uncharacterized protein n=1 Tax=Sphingobium amiense TaxID=135719 RepID=A0A494W7N2_9SPHN|nr:MULTISPECIES: hypothetical protein [Sphingomonadaceae]RQW40333.1 hypothetical protein EH199_20910 [Novosphingobium sp. LASN5T]BBE00545.1 hypothetical protein SAMIE_5000220 [Sphingobium amiense]